MENTQWQCRQIFDIAFFSLFFHRIDVKSKLTDKGSRNIE
jgi:hypothetical protein